MYAELDDADGIERLRLLKKIDTLDFRLEHQGANPKKIDFELLRDHIRASVSFDDAATNKYREKISSRATAIRAMCVHCQGGYLPGIKECASITCPLHPFRMGKDPLRGWQPPKHTAIELPVDDEDDIDEFEDGDEDEGDVNAD